MRTQIDFLVQQQGQPLAKFIWQGNRRGRIQTQVDLMSKHTCILPYKVVGEGISRSRSRQANERRFKERRGREGQGNSKELGSGFSLSASWFKPRLPEAGTGLARMSHLLSMVLPPGPATRD